MPEADPSAREGIDWHQRRLDLALEAGQVGLWDLDLTNDVAFRTLRHDQIFGYSSLQPQWGYEIFLTHVVPEDRPTVKESFEKAFITGIFTMECRITRKDDHSVRWISAQGRVFRNPSGDPIRMMGTVADVTERKRVTEEYDLIFRTTPDLIAIADLDGYFKRLNPSWGRTLGWTSEELLSRPWIDFVHPEDRAATLAEGQKLTTGIPTLQFENRYECKDGSYKWLSWRVPAPSPGTTRLYAIARDLTERKQAEALERDRTRLEVALVERERYADRLAARSAVTGILSEGRNFEDVTPKILKAVCESVKWALGEVWMVDPKAQAVHYVRGWHRPELDLGEFESAARQTKWPIGTGISGRVWASGKAAWIEDVATDAACPRTELAAKMDLHGAFAFPIVTDNRVVAVMMFFSRKVEKPDSDLLGMMTDLGSQIGEFLARQRLHGQLEQSQKVESIGRLAGGIAHDFNNMLTVINGYSQLMLNQLRPGDPLRSDVQEILDAGERASSLTRQLLAFSRNQILVPKVINFNQIVRDMERLLKRLIGEDIELVSSLAPNLDPIKADPGQLEQVIMNLAVNARDAMPDGGKLTLETSNVQLDAAYARSHISVTPGPYVMLAVSDNGVGMDPETQAHLFEPFFTTKEKGKGTGLGLATVYGIVKQSGGNVWVYSEAGQGTTFKIYFPRVQDSLDKASQAVPLPMARGTETLLLVEDEAAVRKLASSILRSNGYTVLEAGNGREALDLVASHSKSIDLLVTDVVMPGMSGRDLSKRMLEIRPGLPVLYLSGYTSNAIVHHGVLDSGVNFLQKPFTPEGLVRKVREVLDAR
jgi:PAS domain S-box-containing protein